MREKKGLNTICRLCHGGVFESDVLDRVIIAASNRANGQPVAARAETSGERDILGQQHQCQPSSSIPSGFLAETRNNVPFRS